MMQHMIVLKELNKINIVLSTTMNINQLTNTTLKPIETHLNSYIQINLVTLDNGRTTNAMVEENKYGAMEQRTRDSG